ncbi:uncharacterized protein [Ambystoma mexicanum]|uniref:uncharacterized protein isoform X2 n=1 Tax=Ambystoma mexicanum TaxID=8296 RepID=UPI0037E9528C
MLAVLLLLLCSVMGTCELQRTVRSTTGSDVTIHCPYKPKYEKNAKYLNKGPHFISSTDVIKTNQPSATNGRFSLVVDYPKSSFHVTIRNVTMNDSGTYYCGVDKPHQRDEYSVVGLSITEEEEAKQELLTIEEEEPVAKRTRTLTAKAKATEAVKKRKAAGKAAGGDKSRGKKQGPVANPATLPADVPRTSGSGPSMHAATTAAMASEGPASVEQVKVYGNGTSYTEEVGSTPMVSTDNTDGKMAASEPGDPHWQLSTANSTSAPLSPTDTTVTQTPSLQSGVGNSMIMTAAMVTVILMVVILVSTCIYWRNRNQSRKGRNSGPSPRSEKEAPETNKCPNAERRTLGWEDHLLPSYTARNQNRTIHHICRASVHGQPANEALRPELKGARHRL